MRNTIIKINDLGCQAVEEKDRPCNVCAPCLAGETLEQNETKVNPPENKEETFTTEDYITSVMNKHIIQRNGDAIILAHEKKRYRKLEEELNQMEKRYLTQKTLKEDLEEKIDYLLKYNDDDSFVKKVLSL